MPAQLVDPVTGGAVTLTRPPRAGDMTRTWRWITALVWISAIAALASVWQTSEQLGLSTWWLGPRGEPRPLLVQLTPFLPAALMVLGAINRLRWIGLWGVAASVIVMAIGVRDVGTVVRLGIIEIAIGVVTAVVSIASLTGTYRTSAGPKPGTTKPGATTAVGAAHANAHDTSADSTPAR